MHVRRIQTGRFAVDLPNKILTPIPLQQSCLRMLKNKKRLRLIYQNPEKIRLMTLTINIFDCVGVTLPGCPTQHEERCVEGAARGAHIGSPFRSDLNREKQRFQHPPIWQHAHDATLVLRSC